MMNNAVKSFDILATSLNILHNYFDNPIKSSSDLYLVSFFRYFSKIVLFVKNEGNCFRSFSQMLSISRNGSIRLRHNFEEFMICKKIELI